MSYYVIVDLDVHNSDAYFNNYAKVVRPIVETAGGVYLARGGEITVYEGSWQPRRIAIQRWPNKAIRDAFRGSPEYLAVKRHRLENATSNIIGIEGLD